MAHAWREVCNRVPRLSRWRCRRFFIGFVAFPVLSGENSPCHSAQCFPDFLKWMPGSKDILLYDRYKAFANKLIAEADVICCLDFNAIHRIDAVGAGCACLTGAQDFDRPSFASRGFFAALSFPIPRYRLLLNWYSGLFAVWVILARLPKKVPSAFTRG